MILMLQDVRFSIMKTPDAEIVKMKGDVESPPSLVKIRWRKRKGGTLIYHAPRPPNVLLLYIGNPPWPCPP